MTTIFGKQSNITIRPLQYRDLEKLPSFSQLEFPFSQLRHVSGEVSTKELSQQIELLRQWYGPCQILSLFPNPYQYRFNIYVAEENDLLRGLIQISPFNRTRSTWRVERVIVDRSHGISSGSDIGSNLLRFSFEKIWEARTWLLEVDIEDQNSLALYRQNGFQPLAQMTYWELNPDQLINIAQRDPDLPNLNKISNADAKLLYQLDTVAMPPLVRQVYDRHIHDFKYNLLSSFLIGLSSWLSHREVVTGYVFEPTRKAAIAYFKLVLCLNGAFAHSAQLTVHPAYTWLYPELLSQMAQVVQSLPPQSLSIASTDYQPERESYLERLGAKRMEHTLLMSRSVWHKLRETKVTNGIEGLKLAQMLSGLQTSRKPVPTRLHWEAKKTDPTSDGKTNK